MMRNTPFDEMDRLFEGMRRSMLGGREWMDYAFGDGNLRMEATDEGYVVHADLPGFETEEIDLRFDDDTLTIDAVHEVTDEGRTRSRRFHEELRVPGEALVEDIEADYHNGVLEVRIPTETPGEDDRGHRIDIN
jgi:HSP20 family protein